MWQNLKWNIFMHRIYIAKLQNPALELTKSECVNCAVIWLVMLVP